DCSSGDSRNNAYSVHNFPPSSPASKGGKRLLPPVILTGLRLHPGGQNQIPTEQIPPGQRNSAIASGANPAFRQSLKAACAGEGIMSNPAGTGEAGAGAGPSLEERYQMLEVQLAMQTARLEERRAQDADKGGKPPSSPERHSRANFPTGRADGNRNSARAHFQSPSLPPEERMARDGHSSQAKEHPLQVTTIDGRELLGGEVSLQTVPMIMKVARHTELIAFNVATLGGAPIILGMSWLALHDPLISVTSSAKGKLTNYPRIDPLTVKSTYSLEHSSLALNAVSEPIFTKLDLRGAYNLAPQPFNHDPACGGRERLGRESTEGLDRGGLLRLSCEYCPENRRLRVRLISVEGLYEPAAEPKSINCCITFSLVPGKIQKQRSTVIKRSRDPIFNEDFFFVGIAEDDLGSLAVRMKAVNKGSSLKRDLLLGESEVPLMKLLAG
ncbi:calcium-dependent domain-containing 4C-like, partial [Podarcis lilfordi]